MASSRDDFIIAIRSAFLKKTTKQKFSLLTLVFLSIFIIFLSSLNLKIINNTRYIINELVFRSSFIVSIPENSIKNAYLKVIEYSNFYEKYKSNKVELEKLKSNEISSRIIVSENNELKNLIEDFTLSSNKILAKVIVDHNSPFLKTIIINKGSLDNIKIGTNIYDKSYLVGRVIEVNYKSSRVLLLTDLNSSIPVSIIPGNIQAIIIGNGKTLGEIKYIKDNLIEKIQDESIAYTSGTGAIYKSGIPVGTVKNANDIFSISFFSDFQQLKYVFAEIEQNQEIEDKSNLDSVNDIDQNNLKNTNKIKLNILNEEIKILSESNDQFLKENQDLKSKINKSNDKILELEKVNNFKDNIISQSYIDQKELEFLRLNLIHSSKCKKSAFRKGYKVGTKEYEKCILKKGQIND